MRVCLESGLPGNEHVVAQWVGHLQEREDALQMCDRPGRLAVFAQMIELVALAERLKNTSQLRDVMRRVLKITLPEDVQSMVEPMLQKLHRMDKGAISRAHLTLDVGFMLHQRVRNHLVPKQVRCLMWDSSPQFGRDYQMCLVQSLAIHDLPGMLQACFEMCQL